MLPKGEIVEVMFKIRVVCTRYLAMYFWLRGICREKKKNIRVSTINRHIIMTAFFFFHSCSSKHLAWLLSLQPSTWGCSCTRPELCPSCCSRRPLTQHQHPSVLILVLILGSDRGRGRSSTIKVSVSARAILKPQQNRHNLMGEIGIIGWYWPSVRAAAWKQTLGSSYIWKPCVTLANVNCISGFTVVSFFFLSSFLKP